MGARLGLHLGSSSKDVAPSFTVDRAVQRHGKVSVVGRHITKRSLKSDFDVRAKVLGTGLSGKVFFAVGRHDQKAYAVKSLCKLARSDLTPDEGEQYARTLRYEVEVHLSLDHPHIARLDRVYETERELHLVMEHLSGGELYDRIVESGRFTESRAANIIWQVLLAVAYMHGHGVVHRDLKPENILFERRDAEHLKLIDFGFAIFYDGQHMDDVVGTCSYCAPEVFKYSYTEKADLFSVGVIAHILLTGKFPIGLRKPHQKARAVDSFDPVHNNTWLPSGARDFMRSLLSVDAARRPSAAEALQHSWLRSHAPGAAPIDTSVLLTLVRFPQASPFRRACLSLAAWTVPLEDQDSLRTQFVALDKDNSGTIGLQELEQSLREELGMGSGEARELFRCLDANNNSEIAYSEFLAAASDGARKLPEEAVCETFRRFDVDHSGAITPEDVAMVLGDSLSCDADKLIIEADYDCDGSVSLDDYRRYLQESGAAVCEPRELTKLGWHDLKRIPMMCSWREFTR
eukprot:CAMPEP_0117568748 /NCGR_PEP_ID=MMETSP0784-20121206/58302_1 /TAXON_ID=39447 /ORGANISM="" /LENGTH=516 /DNA_ID=CAMNT_0005366699 /DNA_START=88 /DNA_END=1638 /DNA_ORIENTATION=-